MKIRTYYSRILLFVFLCLVHRLFRPRADRKKDVKKILIIQPAKLGDMVCVSPLFRIIKQQLPDCTLYVLGDVLYKEMVECNPYVDRYYILKRNIADMFRIIRILKKERIDFCCTNQPAWEWASIAYLSDIPLIVLPRVIGGKSGYNPYRLRYRLYPFFFTLVDYHMGQYSPRQYLKLLQPIGINAVSVKKDVFFTNKAKNEATLYLEQQGVTIGKDVIVAIHPCSANKLKDWGDDKFAALASRLLDKYTGLKIFFTGSKADSEKNKNIIAKVKGKVLNASGKFDLVGFSALLSLVDVFISVDTGPAYIAEALGKYTINIIGPVSEKDQPPVSEHNFVLFNPGLTCRPCSFIMNVATKCRTKTLACLNTIEVDDVIVVFEGIYNKIRKIRDITR